MIKEGFITWEHSEPDPLVTVVTTPATSSSVPVVVTEAGSTVVAIPGRLVMGLVGSCLVPAEAAKTTVLRVQVRITTKALLCLLTLQRGKTGLALGLPWSVGRGTRAVGLGQ